MACLARQRSSAVCSSVAPCAARGLYGRFSVGKGHPPAEPFCDLPLEPRVAERPAAIRRRAQAIDDSLIERCTKQGVVRCLPFGRRAAKSIIEIMTGQQRISCACARAIARPAIVSGLPDRPGAHTGLSSMVRAAGEDVRFATDRRGAIAPFLPPCSLSPARRKFLASALPSPLPRRASSSRGSVARRWAA